MGNIIGYARVSTAKQAAPGTSLESQEHALTDAGAFRIFIDKGISGAKAQRPALDEMLEYLRPGDTVLVTRLDRLGRSMRHLVELVNELKDKGIGFKSLQEGIDTGNINGQLVLNIFASLAEFERGLIMERTAKGLQSARERGKLGGRPPKHDATKIALVKKLHDAGELTPKQIANTAEVSVSTMYRLLKKAENHDA
ncbi:recombinase family protein [Glutamicibacter creatinolyticus]|uniref:recombinase family protein n=1 Tax=Glutamicibacter creatinolyticus TaxID=162496 RepID=UPI0037BE9FE0